MTPSSPGPSLNIQYWGLTRCLIKAPTSVSTILRTNKMQNLKKDFDYGGTMRLGSYKCEISEKTLARKIYKRKIISERHRHRYEMNINYEKQFKR